MNKPNNNYERKKRYLKTVLFFKMLKKYPPKIGINSINATFQNRLHTVIIVYISFI